MPLFAGPDPDENPAEASITAMEVKGGTMKILTDVGSRRCQYWPSSIAVSGGGVGFNQITATGMNGVRHTMGAGVPYTFSMELPFYREHHPKQIQAGVPEIIKTLAATMDVGVSASKGSLNAGAAIAALGGAGALAAAMLDPNKEKMDWDAKHPYTWDFDAVWSWLSCFRHPLYENGRLKSGPPYAFIVLGKTMLDPTQQRFASGSVASMNGFFGVMTDLSMNVSQTYPNGVPRTASFSCSFEGSIVPMEGKYRVGGREVLMASAAKHKAVGKDAT